MPRLPNAAVFWVLALSCAAPAWGQLASVEGPPSVPPRQFAPGVETIIPPMMDPADTVSLHDMVEIRSRETLAWSPKLLADQPLSDDAEQSRFTRNLWCLEFGFKPLRMIRLVDPATESGERLVWYLVYRVKNNGKALKPTFNAEDGEFEAVEADQGSVRFLPHLVLQGQDVAPNGGKIYRAYLDQVLPEATEAIRKREVPGRKLMTAVTMPAKPLAPGEERWGVATWSDVDPEIDFFSIYVRGLTNAYEWTDPPGVYQPGDPPGKGREFVRKTLQLNFWRPGDRFLQHESEVRYGTAPGKAGLYGVEEGVDHAWVYR